MEYKKPEQYFQDISDKLDRLIRISVFSLVEKSQNQKEKIILLSAAGFKPMEIAELLGTTNNVVSITLSSMKKKKQEDTAQSKSAENASEVVAATEQTSHDLALEQNSTTKYSVALTDEK